MLFCSTHVTSHRREVRPGNKTQARGSLLPAVGRVIALQLKNSVADRDTLRMNSLVSTITSLLLLVYVTGFSFLCVNRLISIYLHTFPVTNYLSSQ